MKTPADYYFQCHACGFSVLITDAGVEAMRAHLKAHASDRSVKQSDVYVEAKRQRKN